MLRNTLHELLIGIFLLLGCDILRVKGQQGGNLGVVYIKVDQHVAGYVSSMNTNPKSTKFLLGAWFMPVCAGRVSIPSDTGQPVTSLPNSMAPLFISEKQTNDDNRRSALC